MIPSKPEHPKSSGPANLCLGKCLRKMPIVWEICRKHLGRLIHSQDRILGFWLSHLTGLLIIDFEPFCNSENCQGLQSVKTYISLEMLVSIILWKAVYYCLGWLTISSCHHTQAFSLREKSIDLYLNWKCSDLEKCP